MDDVIWIGAMFAIAVALSVAWTHAMDRFLESFTEFMRSLHDE